VSTRAERRDTTEAAILTVARRLLAEGGLEALTVRGVARELSVAPSGLYRYVRSRQELVGLLISHAYADLADEVEAAHDDVAPEDLRGRWRAFAYALRAWMLAHPHDWMLIQGIPIPGYQAPADPAVLPTMRLHLLLIRLGADAEAAGVCPHVSASGSAPAIPGLPSLLALSGLQISEQTALAGMAGWHLLGGVLYSEVFQLAGNELTDHDRYYDAMVAASERLIFGDAPDD